MTSLETATLLETQVSSILSKRKFSARHSRKRDIPLVQAPKLPEAVTRSQFWPTMGQRTNMSNDGISVLGPNAKCGNVRDLVAIEGKAEVTRISFEDRP
jgi:hypothetical protein